MKPAKGFLTHSQSGSKPYSLVFHAPKWRISPAHIQKCSWALLCTSVCPLFCQEDPIHSWSRGNDKNRKWHRLYHRYIRHNTHIEDTFAGIFSVISTNWNPHCGLLLFTNSMLAVWQQYHSFFSIIHCDIVPKPWHLSNNSCPLIIKDVMTNWWINIFNQINLSEASH